MRGKDLEAARTTLGLRWFGRPMLTTEMGRALRLSGGDVGEAVNKMETREHGEAPLSGPISVCLDLWLAGAEPPDGLEAIRKRGG